MIKYEHRLSPTTVWDICKEHHYYTCGDNESYCKMFDMVRYKNITPNLLRKVAENIKDHSDTEDTLEDIMDTLAFNITVLVKSC